MIRRPRDPKVPLRVITREDYERMWQLYREGNSYSAIAKALNVSHVTVRKYVEKGIPKRGFEPLRKRLEEMNAKSRERMADHHAKKQRKYYDSADKAFGLSLQCAMACMNLTSKFLGKHQNDDVDEIDHKKLNTIMANAAQAHVVMTGWQATVKAYFMGEETDDMTADVNEFISTGAVSEGLKARMRKILGDAPEKSKA